MLMHELHTCHTVTWSYRRPWYVLQGRTWVFIPFQFQTLGGPRCHALGLRLIHGHADLPLQKAAVAKLPERPKLGRAATVHL